MLKKPKFNLENGETVISKITDFEGVITARADHLHGCNRYYVQPKIGEDRKMPDGYWFDEAELTVLPKEKHSGNDSSTGGFHSKTK